MSNPIETTRREMLQQLGCGMGTLGLATAVGLLLMLIGGVWMIGQVIADQSSGADEKRYRDIER